MEFFMKTKLLLVITLCALQGSLMMMAAEEQQPSQARQTNEAAGWLRKKVTALCDALCCRRSLVAERDAQLDRVDQLDVTSTQTPVSPAAMDDKEDSARCDQSPDIQDEVEERYNYKNQSVYRDALSEIDKMKAECKTLEEMLARMVAERECGQKDEARPSCENQPYDEQKLKSTIELCKNDIERYERNWPVIKRLAKEDASWHQIIDKFDYAEHPQFGDAFFDVDGISMWPRNKVIFDGFIIQYTRAEYFNLLADEAKRRYASLHFACVNHPRCGAPSPFYGLPPHLVPEISSLTLTDKFECKCCKAYDRESFVASTAKDLLEHLRNAHMRRPNDTPQVVWM